MLLNRAEMEQFFNKKVTDEDYKVIMKMLEKDVHGNFTSYGRKPTKQYLLCSALSCYTVYKKVGLG